MKFQTSSLFIVVGGVATICAVITPVIKFYFWTIHCESFRAEVQTDIPEEYRQYVAPGAVNILVRSYQQKYWITGEYTISITDLNSWSDEVDVVMGKETSLPFAIDHSVPESVLQFANPKNSEQLIWYEGWSKYGWANLIYDTSTNRLNFAFPPS